MFSIFLVFGIFLFFLFLFFFFNYILSSKVFLFDKVTCFECGFDSVGLVQISFNIQFFMILLIFVIFDLELVIFMSFIVLDLSVIFLFFFLFFFVFFSFFLELYSGKLMWSF